MCQANAARRLVLDNWVVFLYNVGMQGEELKAYIKDTLHYDALTGIITWKKTLNNKIQQGDRAGDVGVKGYERIGIDYPIDFEEHLYCSECWKCLDCDPRQDQDAVDIEIDENNIPC